jgi:hypothetical protein
MVLFVAEFIALAYYPVGAVETVWAKARPKKCPDQGGEASGPTDQ